MKRLAAVALLVAGMFALPAWGQRGGARGGGGGHAMGASRGGFSPSSRPSYADSGTIGMRATGGIGYANGRPGMRVGPGYINRRPLAGRPLRYRAPFAAIPYGYGVTGWLGPDYYDDSEQPVDDGSASNGAPVPPYDPGGDPGGYGVGPVEQGAVAPESGALRPAYRPVQPEPASEDAVTLIFKDGRASEQIHNYILTPTTLFVQDAHRHEIAVADLDLAATEKANHDAGVKFHLPVARK
jgi:hypothetical protein